ncbi:MAG: terminase family protein [Bacteroidota bacterium]
MVNNINVQYPDLADYQKRILNSKARFTITEASTKSGKTFSHMLWLYDKAHDKSTDQKGKKYWWVAPTYSQAEDVFGRLKEFIGPSRAYEFNKSNLRIFCPNGAEIHFKTSSEEDNLYGADVFACVFDEAPRARSKAWTAIRSTLTYTQGPCKLIGNFQGVSNWMHKLKEKAKDDKNYEYHKITCWDAVAAGILKEEEIEQAKRDLTPMEFKMLYEAEPVEGEGMLITYDGIRNLFKNTEVERGIKYITADIARFGKDKTVIMVWDGYQVVYVKSLDSSSILESASEINRIAGMYNVDKRNIIADDDGIGGGVVDILHCIPFLNNSSAIRVKGIEQNFANFKTQCYYKLAEYINEGKIGVTCSPEVERALTEELEWVRLPSEIDTSKLRLMTKDQIKKELGRSPDYSDALMMRMHKEIRPKFGVYDIR